MQGSEGPPNELIKILPFMLIILFVFSCAHYFIFLISSRSLEHHSLKLLYIAVLTLGMISMPVGFFMSHSKKSYLFFLIWVGYIWMGLFNFLFFFSLIEFFIFIFFQHSYSFWVIVASLGVGIWSLYHGLAAPLLNIHKLKSEKLQGLKLVQISDLHIGMLHLNERWLSLIVERINILKPDIIAITGDLVEGEFSRISPQLNVLKSLTGNSKKYYITGNHEYIHGAGPWEKKLEELGFAILHNQNEIIDFNQSKLLIAGVPDRMIGRFIKNKESLPDTALKNIQQVDYKILLAHQPSSVFDLKIETCDLILSGHTHGGQLFPFHVFVRLLHPVIVGFKTINNIKVFAHQGTGLWGPPMRWFSRGEIVLIEWDNLT